MTQAVKINEMKAHFEQIQQDREAQHKKEIQDQNQETKAQIQTLMRENLKKQEAQDAKMAELTEQMERMAS